MRIGKIKSTQVFDDRRIFSGTDVTAEFIDNRGYPCEVSFRYDFATLNLAGLVQKVLQSVSDGKPAPKNISNIKTE